MSRRPWRGPALAVVVALALLGTGCGGYQSEVTPARERVVVAVVGGFTGPNPVLAEAMGRGAELAIREYNGDPRSSFRAALQREDTGGTADGAQGAAERLAGRELLIGVIGPGTLEEAQSAGRTFAQAEIPMLLPAITETDLSDAGLGHYRRLVAHEHRQGVVAGAEAAAKAAGEKVAILSDGSGGAADFTRGAREAVEGAKAAISRVETLRPRTDLASLARAIAEEGTGLVVHAGTAEGAGASAAALRAAGFNGPLLASAPARDPRFAEWAKEGATGTLAVSPAAAVADPRLTRFARSYRRVFGKDAPPYAVESYEGALMLLEAVEEVEPRAAEVASFFRSARSFLGDSKLYTFDDRGELLDAPVWIEEFRDGRWQFLRRAGGQRGDRR